MSIFKKKPIPTIADKMAQLAREEKAREEAARELKKQELCETFKKTIYPKLMSSVEISARKGYSSCGWTIPKSFHSLDLEVLGDMLKKDGFKASTNLCEFHPIPCRMEIVEYKEVLDISWWRKQ